MDIRKVQKTGGASYIVSLPKRWADTFNIKEKSKVGIISRPDGTLVILPRVDQPQYLREKTIDVDKGDHDQFLFRLLVGTYIMGYNYILIKSGSRNRLDSSVKATVRRFINMAIGLEITEETADSLTIKDLLNPAEMKFKVWIERMSQLVISRLNDAINAMTETSMDICQDIIDRDYEINRLHWIISRQHNILMRNTAYAEMLDENKNVNYSLIARIMERIGDYAVRIAENLHNINIKSVDKDLVELIVQAGDDAILLFTRAIETFFSGGINEANKIIESVKNLVKKCENIEKKILQQETVIGVSLGYINEAIRRTGENSMDLCEYTINFLIGNE